MFITCNIIIYKINFPEKQLKIAMPCGPTIPLRGIYTMKIKTLIFFKKKELWKLYSKNKIKINKHKHMKDKKLNSFVKTTETWIKYS